MEKEKNVRELIAGDLFKKNSKTDIHLVILSYKDKSRVVTAIMNSPESNPINVVCQQRALLKNNPKVLLCPNDKTLEENINSLSTEQQIRAKEYLSGIR